MEMLACALNGDEGKMANLLAANADPRCSDEVRVAQALRRLHPHLHPPPNLCCLLLLKHARGAPLPVTRPCVPLHRTAPRQCLLQHGKETRAASRC